MDNLLHTVIWSENKKEELITLKNGNLVPDYKDSSSVNNISNLESDVKRSEGLAVKQNRSEQQQEYF